jgi:hypothetical protein
LQVLYGLAVASGQIAREDRAIGETHAERKLTHGQLGYGLRASGVRPEDGAESQARRVKVKT